VNQMIGYDMEQKAADRKMNAWTLKLFEAVRGLQGMADDQCVIVIIIIWMRIRAVELMR